MKVYKHTFTLTVLSTDRNNIPQLELTQLAKAIYEGEDIGNCEHVDTVLIPPDKVEEELLEIGNDGTFFDEPE